MMPAAEILKRMKVVTRESLVTGMHGKEKWQILTDESIELVINAVLAADGKHNACP